MCNPRWNQVFIGIVHHFSPLQKANLPLDEEDDRPDADDEQPLVVVLKDGDLTKDEYEKHKTEKNDKTGRPIKFIY